MNKFYYDTENNSIISENELKAFFETSEDDRKNYWTFLDYIENCLTKNNGTLVPVPSDFIPDLYEWETGDFWSYENAMESLFDENQSWIENDADHKYNTVKAKQEIYTEIMLNRFIVIDKRGNK